MELLKQMFSKDNSLNYVKAAALTKFTNAYNKVCAVVIGEHQ
jgi:hypothetical protein